MSTCPVHLSPPCECPLAGYCERHQRSKGPLNHQLCQTNPAYRTLWDRQIKERELVVDVVMQATVRPPRPKPPPSDEPPKLKDRDVAELFPGESDPTLLGNRIAALTSAIGFPPCGGCTARKNWLNKAHAWLRGDLTAITQPPAQDAAP